MAGRSDVPPSTLPVEIGPDAVAVEYLDGRRAVYRADRERTAGPVRCRPGTDVQVLVTGPDGTEGVMVYVDDRRTHDDVLESTGVGRLVLDRDDEEELIPGVTARSDGYAVEIAADPAAAGGRVFVFEDDELGERAVEIVGDGD